MKGKIVASVLIVTLLLSCLFGLFDKETAVYALQPTPQSNKTDANIIIDPVIYIHGINTQTSEPMSLAADYMFKGNIISDGSLGKYGYATDLEYKTEKATKISIANNYTITEVLCPEHGAITITPDGNNVWTLHGVVPDSYINNNNVIELIVKYIDADNNEYTENVYPYVMTNPVDAHVAAAYTYFHSSAARDARLLFCLNDSDGVATGSNIGNYVFLNDPSNLPYGWGFRYNENHSKYLTLNSENSDISTMTMAGANIGAGGTKSAIGKRGSAGNVTNEGSTTVTGSYYFDTSLPEYTANDPWTISATMCDLGVSTAICNESGHEIRSDRMGIFNQSDPDMYFDYSNYSNELANWAWTGAAESKTNMTPVKTTVGGILKVDTNSTTPQTATLKADMFIQRNKTDIYAGVTDVINLEVYVYDKSIVRNYVEEIKSCSLIASDYTKESWIIFQNALKNAYAYLNNYKNVDDSIAIQNNINTQLKNAYEQLFSYADYENFITAYNTLLPALSNKYYSETSRNNASTQLNTKQEIIVKMMNYNHDTITTAPLNWDEITNLETDKITGDTVSKEAAIEYRELTTWMTDLYNSLERQTYTLTINILSAEYTHTLTYNEKTITLTQGVNSITVYPNTNFILNLDKKFADSRNLMEYRNIKTEEIKYIDTSMLSYSFNINESDVTISEILSNLEYTVTIPDTISVNSETNKQNFNITAIGIQELRENESLSISLGADNTMTIANVADSSIKINYQVSKNNNIKNPGDELCKFSNSPDEQSQTFELLVNKASIAGSYSGPLLFDININ